MSSQAILDNPTLVLNKSWQPIQTTRARQAIGMVASGAAYIVDTDDYRVHDLDSWHSVGKARDLVAEDLIRSPRLDLPVPDVIVLTNYAGIGDRKVVFSRANLFRRDRYTCQYCAKRLPVSDLTIDHVHPRSRGGKSTWDNCVLACVPCNQRKANRTPEEAGMMLRTVPRRPTRSAFLKLAPRVRRESWDKFLDRAYWETELEE